MTWRLPDTYHLAGHGRGTATLKFYEGRDILVGHGAVTFPDIGDLQIGRRLAPGEVDLRPVDAHTRVSLIALLRRRALVQPGTFAASAWVRHLRSAQRKVMLLPRVPRYTASVQ